MRYKKMPSLEYLREQINYCPESGTFTWASKRKGRFHRDTAGSAHLAGYITICIDKFNYLSHRLAWYLHYESEPDGVIDHIDGDKANNRISNLRLGTTGQNLQNLKTARIDNFSGFLGVAKHPRGFTAQINLDGKKIHIGTFKTPEEAHEAYLKKKREIHEFCEI